MLKTAYKEHVADLLKITATWGGGLFFRKLQHFKFIINALPQTRNNYGCKNDFM